MNLRAPFFLIIAGKPESGKSYLIKYLMMLNNPQYSGDPFQYGIVFTKTKFNGGYDYLPQKFVHSIYREEVLRNLLRIQSETQAQYRCFVIFDDCLEAFNSNLFTDLSTQYRHYNISLIVSTQYIYKVPPTFRECASAAAIFRQTTERSIRALYDSFGQWFKDYGDFCEYLLENTGEHKFIMFDAKSAGDKSSAYKIMKSPSNLPNFEYIF